MEEENKTQDTNSDAEFRQSLARKFDELIDLSRKFSERLDILIEQSEDTESSSSE